MQTAKSGDIPSENFGVFRLRRQVINEYSLIGGMLTSRMNNKGNNNFAAGIDGVYRVFGDDYFSFSFARSFDDTLRGSLDSSSRLRTSWKRRINTGFGYDISYVWAASNYKPGVGFITREDFKRFGNYIFYGKILNEKSSIYNYNVRLNGELILRNSDNKTESSNFGPALFVSFKSGAATGFLIGRSYESLDEVFELSDSAAVDTGNYTFTSIEGFYQSPWARKIKAALNASIGNFYDGTRRSFGIEPSWNVSPHLELGGAFVINRIRFDDRNQKFDGNIVRIKIKATLNTVYSGNAFFQYNSETKQTSLNVRLRYNPKEGNDLYIVYSELLNEEDKIATPVPPRSESKSLLIKYSYTFQVSNY